MTVLEHSPPAFAHSTPVPSRPLPAWPVNALLWGFPLWWVLGMTPFIAVVLATVMAALLLVRRGLHIVAGVAPWLAFVAWVFPCALMLDSALRLVGYSQRTANYLAVAVVLVYVVNARERLTSRHVIAGLTAVWVTTVVGGYLGVLFPNGRLTTPVGLLLPESITSNEYVFDLVFPPFAEVQQPWGAPEPYNRPAAPFPYTNGWGSAMSLLTPVVFAQLCTARSLRIKVFLGGCLIAAVVPSAATLNRGLLIALAVAVSYVALRLMVRGSVLPFVGLVCAGLAAAYFAVSSGLLAALQERAQYGSTDDRMALYRETFDRTLESPVFGYGAPRPSELLDISAGTQGHIWMLMFSFGFVGLALFLWFLCGAALRTWRAPTTALLWLHSTLLVAGTLIVVYGIDTMQMLTITLVAAILLRDPAVTTGRRT